MKIVAISDTHDRHQGLKLPKGDVLIHAGDINAKSRLADVQAFLAWFARQPFAHKIFIAGNHDFYFEKTSASVIASLLPPGVTYLQDSGTIVNGILIWGSPVTPWFYNWAFNRRRGAAIEAHWKKIPADTRLLLTHGPAYGILDVAANGDHVGDKGLLKTIETVKPAVHVCGHVHEAYGRMKKGSTQFINASVLNEKYELVHPPMVFEL